jgi:hypothetical protein
LRRHSKENIADSDHFPAWIRHLTVGGKLYMLNIILLVFAFVCFCCAAFWNPNPPRVNLIAAGLAFWVLAVLLAGAHLP